MEHSEQLGELATALSKAQSEIRDAKEDAVNPHFKAKYATLSAVWDAFREPLTKNGLSLVQGLCSSSQEGYVGLSTTLLHSSGQWMRTTCFTRLGKDDPQGVGSACTYLRRYQAAAMMGVCPSDDDANSASASPGQQRQNAPAARQEAQETAPAPSWQDRCLAMMGLKFPMADTELLRRQVYSALTGKNVATVSNWQENHWQGVLVRLEKLDPAQHKEIIATLEGKEDDPFADPNEGATPPAQSLGL